MIEFRAQSYYVPGVPTDLQLIYPNGICTPEVQKGTFINHCIDNHDSYEGIKFNEDKKNWDNTELVEKVYIKDEPDNNLPTNEDNLLKQKQKKVNALVITIYVTKMTNPELNPSQKELLIRNFRLGHIGLQHVQWLILTGV